MTNKNHKRTKDAATMQPCINCGAPAIKELERCINCWKKFLNTEQIFESIWPSR